MKDEKGRNKARREKNCIFPKVLCSKDWLKRRRIVDGEEAEEEEEEEKRSGVKIRRGRGKRRKEPRG